MIYNVIYFLYSHLIRINLDNKSHSYGIVQKEHRNLYLKFMLIDFLK
jgi:hypothetical protein